jgi:hypothetical protein
MFQQITSYSDDTRRFFKERPRQRETGREPGLVYSKHGRDDLTGMAFREKAGTRK